MTKVELRTVNEDEADIRLDRWFKRHYPDLAFGRLAKLLRTGQVRVDGRRAQPSARLRPGQEIRVPPLPAITASAETGSTGVAPPSARTPAAPPDPEDAEHLRAAVLYRDDWVIAINKPPGLATQGGSGLARHLDAMLDALRADDGDNAGERPRLVHRLDKDTSGVLLLAPSAAAAETLTRAFRSKETRKLYWALTAGVPRPKVGEITLPLAKTRRGRDEKMAHDPDGKPAQTAYRTIATARGGTIAWVALSPLTGRTHQLRAHMAALGTPILGDGKYGGRAAFPEAPLVRRLQLHAREIALPHPADGTTLRVTAPLPEHIAASFAALDLNPEAGEGIDPPSG